ncbi:hypothetical protein [Silvibacterium acidisoli]|uniref:hypothetical protein n=1 Tax=Acidobacteriaceae bacterium ZG23-2 TaxID=2883246 RepID=UPI00406CDE4C
MPPSKNESRVLSRTDAPRGARALERRRPLETVGPDPDGPEWELVLRITTAERFQRSALLTDFLLYITRQALTGNSARINEHQIGIQVFGREEKFNRSDDNIVRNYARILRSRLDEYFQREGAQESLRLHIPRGGYLPVFSPVAEADVEAPGELPVRRAISENLPPPAAIVPPTPARRVLPAGVVLALGCLLGFVIAFAQPWNWHRLFSPTAHRSHLFWRSIFNPDQDSLLVPSDNGLVTLRRFVGQPITLRDYVSGTYISPDGIDEGLHQLLHTSDRPDLSVLGAKIQKASNSLSTNIEDLDLVVRLSSIAEVVPGRLRVRATRKIQVDDLKNSNAVLIGSLDANPWVSLFQPQLNFQFTPGGPFGNSAVIMNRDPRPGEAKTYASITGDPALRTYGVIAYVPNLSGNGHVLLIEGINVAGTQAAGEFLLDPARMAGILKRASTPTGQIRPFEVLLGTSSVGTNSSEIRILGERISSG